MSSQVDEILAEIDARAADRLGEIVVSAFEHAEVYCPHCEFGKNPEDWIKRVRAYANEKVEIFRQKKWLNRLLDLAYSDIDSDVDPTKQHISRWRIPYVKKQIEELQKQDWRLGAMVVKNYPCPECKKRFNPTLSTKWGPLKVPKIRDFFDERANARSDSTDYFNSGSSRYQAES